MGRITLVAFIAVDEFNRVSFSLSLKEGALKKITIVVITNSHCKSFIISGTIFYSWDYYNHIVESTIIILYYIFLVGIAVKNIFSRREL